MPIPAFEKIMLPLLHDLENGERTGQESLDALAAQFQLTPSELAIRNPSGRAATFSNRIGWAKSHLKSAGLIESPRRGVYRLTERGRQILGTNPPAITLRFLDQFPEHAAFRG